MQIENIPVVILAGGKGTRLGTEFDLLPKPLVKIGELPILIHIMSIYFKCGIENFFICIGFKSEKFFEYFEGIAEEREGNSFFIEKDIFEKLLDGKVTRISKRVKVTLLETGLDTTTGGRLKKALEVISSEFIFATYGDGVADIDIRKVLDFHVRNRFEATISAFHPPSRFGEIVSDHKGQVISFKEKQLSTSLVNAGFLVVNQRVRDQIDEGESLEEGLLSSLTNKGLLGAVKFETKWQMMDTPREVELLRNAVARGKPFWLHSEKDTH